MNKVHCGRSRYRKGRFGEMIMGMGILRFHVVARPAVLALAGLALAGLASLGLAAPALAQGIDAGASDSLGGVAAGDASDQWHFSLGLGAVAVPAPLSYASRSAIAFHGSQPSKLLSWRGCQSPKVYSFAVSPAGSMARVSGSALSRNGTCSQE